MAKDELASPVDCSTAQTDIRILEDERASVVKQIENGVTAIMPVGAVLGILSRTEKEKLEVGTHYYNHKINEKIAEINREYGIIYAISFHQGEHTCARTRSVTRSAHQSILRPWP